jgi:hypothetical protein
MSQEDQLDLVAALFPEQIQELLDRLAVTSGTCHTSRPVSWSTTTVRYRCPLRIEISSTPIRLSPANRWRAWVASPVTRVQIQPTVRQATRISCETAVVDAWNREPRDLILELAGERGVASGLRDRGDDHAVTLAAHSGRFGLEVRERRPEVQRPPTPAAVALTVPASHSRSPPSANLFGAAIPGNLDDGLRAGAIKGGDLVCLAGLSHVGDYAADALV